MPTLKALSRSTAGRAVTLRTMRTATSVNRICSSCTWAKLTALGRLVQPLAGRLFVFWNPGRRPSRVFSNGDANAIATVVTR